MWANVRAIPKRGKFREHREGKERKMEGTGFYTF